MNRWFFSTVIIVPFLFACSSEREEERKTEGREHVESHGDEHAHAGENGKASWGYGGETGPEYWGELKEEFTPCKTGQNQSPVNIEMHRAVDHDLPAIEFRYKEVPLSVVNNGHTIQVNYPLGSSIKVGNASYELVQFHFHTPSEHAIDGKVFPMVVHLVHKDAEGNLGVVGVMIAEGSGNPAIETIWKVMPKKAGEEVSDSNISINASALLPQDRGYYSYTGSLTTPPCSESVNWMVLKAPIESSREQVAALAALFGSNVRPIQPLNDRVVRH